MRIFGWKRLVGVMLVGLFLCCGAAVRAFADDDGQVESRPVPARYGEVLDGPAPQRRRFGREDVEAEQHLEEW